MCETTEMTEMIAEDGADTIETEMTSATTGMMAREAGMRVGVTTRVGMGATGVGRIFGSEAGMCA
jgi:hypothetical protein